ncbi:MAG: hypothetical protein QFB87_04160 [Patescibacteria group bacterium]|nr:hypothetical protein [Patescibacteria group bacterium]
MNSLLLLGRQPALGLAELESLYGSSVLTNIGDQAVIVALDAAQIDFNRLGGATKLCRVVHELDTVQWRQVEKFLMQAAPRHASQLPEGKLTLGLSVQGFDVNIRQLEATGLNLKKVIRKTGRSVRLVPNKELELNTAQVHHNKLTGPMGWELVIVTDGDRTVIGQTVQVQDIASYTYRDRERPKRDARVGMLPPKLAQLLINLAVGPLSAAPAPAGQIILDPFCGTGVLLQEAALMGYTPYGTDLEQRMIDYSGLNFDWLNTQYRLNLPADFAKLAKGDATNFVWDMPVNYVAGETYLGKPFTRPPAAEALAQTVADCNLIIKKFLRNIHSQVPAGTRFCLAVPAWATTNAPAAFKILPLVDQISDLGYNRVSFEHAGNDELIYFRPDQYVARQLLVLVKQ